MLAYQSIPFHTIKAFQPFSGFQHHSSSPSPPDLRFLRLLQSLLWASKPPDLQETPLMGCPVNPPCQHCFYTLHFLCHRHTSVPSPAVSFSCCGSVFLGSKAASSCSAAVLSVPLFVYSVASALMLLRSSKPFLGYLDRDVWLNCLVEDI